jgi:hypothetical protein
MKITGSFPFHVVEESMRIVNKSMSMDFSNQFQMLTEGGFSNRPFVEHPSSAFSEIFDHAFSLTL